MGWAFRTLDGAGTFHGMGMQTLDGAGTFHGMGIIGAATPGTKHRKAIRREVTATPETVSCTMGRLFIRYFDASVVDHAAIMRYPCACHSVVKTSLFEGEHGVFN